MWATRSSAGRSWFDSSDELLVADVSSKRAAKLQAEAQLVTASSDRRRGDLVKDSGALSSSELEKLHNDELAAQARVQQANADLESAEVKLRYAHVLSPDDGVITSRTVVVGQIAQAGNEMLRLLRNGRVEWRAEIPEGRLRDVHVGQTVRVTTADGSELTGRVRTVAPTVQSGTRTGLVYVDLPKPDGARPGNVRARRDRGLDAEWRRPCRWRASSSATVTAMCSW